MAEAPVDARLTAGIDLLGRTGARHTTIRYDDPTDDGDEGPVVWIAVATWQRPGETATEVAAALDPVRAVLRLCEQVVDGGQCTHCGRRTGFDPDFGTMPLGNRVCWYQFDPELEQFRRGCA
jgi:hypothetical protein